MEPNFSEEVVYRRQSLKSKKRRFQFMAMPYISLSKYSTTSSSPSSDQHPMRTLLQSSLPSTTSNRELQQAVCQLENGPKDTCFHVPQIWCLVFDNCESFLYPYVYHATDFFRSSHNLCPIILLTDQRQDHQPTPIWRESKPNHTLANPRVRWRRPYVVVAFWGLHNLDGMYL